MQLSNQEYDGCCLLECVPAHQTKADFLTANKNFALQLQRTALLADQQRVGVNYLYRLGQRPAEVSRGQLCRSSVKDAETSSGDKFSALLKIFL